jgi:hypothetical protein
LLAEPCLQFMPLVARLDFRVVFGHSLPHRFPTPRAYLGRYCPADQAATSKPVHIPQC